MTKSNRRKEERSMLSAERTFRTLCDNMLDGYAYHKVIYDETGYPVDYLFLEVNDAFEKLTCLKRNEIIGKRVSEVLSSKDSSDWISIFGKVTISGQPIRFEKYSESLNRWYLVSAYSFEKGYFTTVFEDITSRKQLESKLELERDNLTNMANSMKDGVYIVNQDYEITFANRALTETFGPWQGKKCYQYLHDRAEICPWCKNEEVFKGNTVRWEWYSPKTHRTYDLIDSPINNSDGSISKLEIFRDVTDHKRLEEENQTRNQLNSLILDSMPNPTMLVRRDRTVIAANKIALGMGAKIGEPCQRLFGKGPFTEKAHKCWFCLADESLEKTTSRHCEVEALGRIWDTWWVPADKETYLHFAVDITDRKELEADLRNALTASNRRQLEIFALLKASRAVLEYREFKHSAKAIFDSCKELLEATAGYIALLSRDEKENAVVFLDAGGLPCTVDSSLPMPIRGLRGEAYEKGKSVYCNDFLNSQWAGFMPSGHVQLRNVLFAPLKLDGRLIGIMGLANKHVNFTERDAEMATAFGEIASIALVNSQTLETLETLVEERTKKLKDSERLSAIGAVAGMVGHDIRNPLQAMISDVYLALSDLESMPDGDIKGSIRGSLDNIQKNIEYVSKIVQDLQDYARPITPAAQEVNLCSLCEEVLSKTAMPENVAATYRVEDDARVTVSDFSLLKRILSNLTTNAVQAMPEGGRLDVYAYKSTDSLLITVQDTGVGIPAEVKGKLFTPMFTTKAKGQGFGLAVIKRLTEALGGTVTYESELGKGTKFTIRLPSSH